MIIKNVLKKGSPLFLAALLAACGGESAKEAKTGEKEEKAEAGDESTAYTVQKDKSSFQWTGRKKTGMHKGTIDLRKGSLKSEEGELKAGSFEIDMTSIEVSDDMDPEYKKKLTSHLRDSSDFFNAPEYPTAKFELTGVKPYEGDSAMKIGLDTLKKEPTHWIAGNLTIKETTKNVSEIPAWIDVSDDRLRALTEFSFDRTRWGIEYKSKSVLDNLKDGFIHDKVDLRISLHATPSKEKEMAEGAEEKKKDRKSS